MTHSDLVEAGEALRAAAEATDDAGIADGLREQAEHMETLAERNPDHGRMARHESKLQDLAEDGGPDVENHVGRALEHIHTYRETVEGV